MLTLILRISQLLKNISAYIATSLLAFLAIILLLQVCLRYIFNYSLSWPEEASRYAMIWVVLLIAGVLVRDKELVTVDFFDRIWPQKVIIYRDLAYRILLVFVLYVLFKEGISQAIAGWRMRTTALEMRWFWPYLAVPVGAGLMLFQMFCLSIEEIVQYLAKRKKNE